MKNNSYPKKMQIIKNCHWNDNIHIRVIGWLDELIIRKLCELNGWYLVNSPATHEAANAAAIGKEAA